ncbi:MAG: hypothetical protein M0P09_08450 [Acholeplasmataceae bacterium]|nr:hypothetical protein [Acholeplasmataceae bacterium]
MVNAKRMTLNYTEMVIFNYLFGKKKFPKISEKDIKDLIDNYEPLKEVTERLQEENKYWCVDLNKIIELRQQAKKLEQLNKIDEAISVYLQSIECDELSTRLNINTYIRDIERVIILFSQIKKQTTLTRFRGNKIDLYSVFQET